MALDNEEKELLALVVVVLLVMVVGCWAMWSMS